MIITTKNERLIILLRHAIDALEKDLNKKGLSGYAYQILSDEFTALHRQLKALQGAQQ
jgi:hypothetical protein